jgi:hypothetical protein
MMCNKKDSFEDLGFLIVKNNLPIEFVESVWLKYLAFHLFPMIFPLIEGIFHTKYYQGW